VLEKAPEIPDIVTAGLPTAGLRMPDHPIALELIEAAGVPIAAPSANRFTHLSPTTPEHVREEFGDAVEILEGGSSRVGIESTVVSLAGGSLTLLRPGQIWFEEIEQACAPELAAHPSPGMHPRHYSPTTLLLLVNHPNELPDRHGAYMWRQESGIASRSVRMPRDPASYANRLYSVLHELDRERWPWIAVELPPDRPDWAAIRDRLRRASGKR
jgi:L-threonylcarbamoyladenylate synthase